MKFRVNTSQILLFFVAALLIFSCRKREVVGAILDEPVVFSVAASGSASQQSVSGKAVSDNNNSFHQGSQIGIYATRYDQTEVELAEPGNSNIGYNNLAGSTQWTSVDAENPIRFLRDDVKMNFYAYHPYISQAGSTVVLSATSAGAGTLSYSLPLNQSSVLQLTNADLMWGASFGVAQSSGVVKLEFQHKLTKIAFSVLLGNGWASEQFRVSRIELIGSSMPQSASLKVSSGVLESAAGVATTIYSDYGNAPLLLHQYNAHTCEFIAVPTLSTPIEVRVVGTGSIIGDRIYRASIGTFELKAATQRNVTLKINRVTPVEVFLTPTVAAWDVINDIGMDAI